MFVILVYDVEQERDPKILKTLRKYLKWVQRSVFEGELSKAQLASLKAEIRSFLDVEKDSVVIYTFRTKAYYRKEILGTYLGEEDDMFV